MNQYYKVTLTVRAETDEEANYIVERGVDKQGWVVYDISSELITDKTRLDELKYLDEEE